MKIAILIKHFTYTKGGLEKYTYNLTRELINSNCEIHIYAHTFTINEKDQQPFNAVFWHKVPMLRKPSWLKVYSFAKNVDRMLRNSQYDIIYSMTQTYPYDLYRLGDGIIKHWYHQSYPHKFLRYGKYITRPVYIINLYLEKQLFHSKKTYYIANSHYYKNLAAHYYPGSSSRLHVIYNGVDTARFNPQAISHYRNDIRQSLGLDEHNPLLLFVGNNWERKGLQTLLQTMAALRQRSEPHHLLIVGKGNPKNYMHFIKKHSLSKQIHFVAPTEQIERYYSAADLFVYPTLNDPFANVCLEAMACALPVITSKTNGASELIVDGWNGYLIDELANPQKLLKKIIQSGNIESLMTMGSNACELAKNYTIKQNVNETIKLFESIIEEKRYYDEYE